MTNPTAQQLHRALVTYHARILEARTLAGALRNVGLETYSEAQLERWQSRTQKAIERCSKPKITASDLDAISDDLDEQRLGTIAWDDAVEHAKGRVVTAYDACDKALT